MFYEETSSASLVSVIVEDPAAFLIGYLHLVQDPLICQDGIQFLFIRQHVDESGIILVQFVRISPEEAVDHPLIR